MSNIRAQVQPAVATFATLLQALTDSTTVLTLIVCNEAGTQTANIKITWAFSGASDAPGQAILVPPLAVNASHLVTTPINMRKGDLLRVSTDTAGVTFTACGVDDA